MRPHPAPQLFSPRRLALVWRKLFEQAGFPLDDRLGARVPELILL